MAAPYYLVATAFYIWWGGTTAPARYAVPITLLLVVPSAFWFATAKSVAARMASLSALALSLFVTATVASVISRLPTRVLVPALHAQADSVDFAATALPGLHGPRKICGAVVEATYPFGPRLGCPANITAFGNDDRLDVGITFDPAAITDAPQFLNCLNEAFDIFVGKGALVTAE